MLEQPVRNFNTRAVDHKFVKQKHFFTLMGYREGIEKQFKEFASRQDPNVLARTDLPTF